MEKIVLTMLMLGVLFGASYAAGAVAKTGLEIFDMRSDVAVVRISGDLGNLGTFPPSSSVTARSVRALIDEALSSPTTGAIVFEINSGGGSASETELIAREISKAGEAVPTVAYVPEIAASGGYWIASETNEIFVSPLAMTGSIGVYSQFINASELYRKIGIETKTVKSGKYKDLGDPSRGITAEEEKMAQGMSDYVYDQFVGAVAENRNMTRAQVLPLAQGQVFMGTEGVYNGLVDRIGYLDDAVARAGELAKIKDPRTVEIESQPTFEEMLTQVSAKMGKAFLTGVAPMGGWKVFT